jgi:hypothetical protein
MSTSVHGAHARTPAERHLRLAWASVIAIPFALAGAMAVGEGLLSALGYTSEQVVPLSVALKAAGPALLLAVAPTVGAMYYGWRARREGLGQGTFPAVIGGVVAFGFVGLNVLAYVVGRLTG